MSQDHTERVILASGSAMLYSAEKSRTEDYGEPEADYYADRDPWYTQFQLGRLCPETVWGHRMAMPRSAPVQNAVLVSVQTAPEEGDMICGARRYPVPLDAPDVALRGPRLLAYG